MRWRSPGSSPSSRHAPYDPPSRTCCRPRTTSGTSWSVTALSGTIGPGQYYLVQEEAGANQPAPLPTPDATGTIPMSANNGKVALATSTTALACGADCDADPTVRDFVGYGTANDFEGSGPVTPSLAANTAALRAHHLPAGITLGEGLDAEP